MHWINRGPFCVLLLLLLVADCCQPLTDFLIYIPIHRWLFLYSYFIRYIVYICVFVVWNVGIMSVMLLLCNEIVCNGWHGWPPDGFYTVERENVFEKVEKEKKNTHKNKSPVRCFGFLIYENDVYFDSSASIRFIQLERNDQLYEKGL